MNELEKYFPNLSKEQLEKFRKLTPLYDYWNSKVNLISRNDVDKLDINNNLKSTILGTKIAGGELEEGGSIINIGSFPGVLSIKTSS